MTKARSGPVLLTLAVAALLAFTGFVALGIWQVERRAWKLDLIETIDARVHAAPVPPPAPGSWGEVNAADDAYRRVRIAGTFLHDRETFVQATTELGAGYWLLTPLQADDGRIVLVNRGFVPPEARDRAARGAPEPPGPVTVTGLLRISEPRGSFLRGNDPAADRWYSRDVPAIAAARGLDGVAPFFVDAEAAPASPSATANAARTWPAGGLTVIRFQNSHLVYAITWFALAAMVAAAAVYVGRDAWRSRRAGIGEDTPHD